MRGQGLAAISTPPCAAHPIGISKVQLFAQGQPACDDSVPEKKLLGQMYLPSRLALEPPGASRRTMPTATGGSGNLPQRGNGQFIIVVFSRVLYFTPRPTDHPPPTDPDR